MHSSAGAPAVPRGCFFFYFPRHPAHLRASTTHPRSPRAGNYASPKNAGFIQKNVGWVNSTSLNATIGAENTYYTAFDVSTFNTFSATPRVYKTLEYTPNEDPAGTLTPSITTTPVWTVIITLAKGVPTSVTYDEGCFFCASNGPDCLPSAFNADTNIYDLDTNATNPGAMEPTAGGGSYVSCVTREDKCYPSQPVNQFVYGEGANISFTPSATPVPTPSSSPNSTAGIAVVPDASCDLKVFVVWDGTDANGNFLKSSNRRFSVYRAFAVASAFQSALNLVQQGFDVANSVKAVAENLPGMLTPGGALERLPQRGAPPRRLRPRSSAPHTSQTLAPPSTPAAPASGLICFGSSPFLLVKLRVDFFSNRGSPTSQPK